MSISAPCSRATSSLPRAASRTALRSRRRTRLTINRISLSRHSAHPNGRRLSRCPSQAEATTTTVTLRMRSHPRSVRHHGVLRGTCRLRATARTARTILATSSRLRRRPRSVPPSLQSPLTVPAPTRRRTRHTGWFLHRLHLPDQSHRGCPSMPAAPTTPTSQRTTLKVRQELRLGHGHHPCPSTATPSTSTATERTRWMHQDTCLSSLRLSADPAWVACRKIGSRADGA
mmetsp:Transcript_76816/g.178176  ORF Transcript_76816/g.178176 Transcript_76816/m.178176 type:complete len:230 (-) Transcript_76816:10-699(-)